MTQLYRTALALAVRVRKTNSTAVNVVADAVPAK